MKTATVSNATVVSVNISEAKGTIKHPVAEITLNERGIKQDAHAGQWHRQISLLSQESIDFFAAEAGQTFAYGEFAENITTVGVDWKTIRIGTRFRIGDTELELTQIGKECHGGDCAVYRAVGRCVMPHEGVFAKVIVGGKIRPGDSIILLPYPLTAVVLTLSDRISRGEAIDLSGPAIKRRLKDFFDQQDRPLTLRLDLLPDDTPQIQAALHQAIIDHVDLVFTTGGTGIGPRDVTPEAIRPLLDREWAGIMDAVRQKHFPQFPAAALSRSLAGVADKTLVFALPGSENAVNDYLDVIFTVLEHALRMVKGEKEHH